MKTVNKKLLATREEMIEVLRGGKMASIKFIKNDGSLRVMNGQFRNKSLLKEARSGGRSPNNSDIVHNTITMAEFGAYSGGGNFKRFRVDRVLSIKARGKEYYGPKGWEEVEKTL